MKRLLLRPIEGRISFADLRAVMMNRSPGHVTNPEDGHGWPATPLGVVTIDAPPRVQAGNQPRSVKDGGADLGFVQRVRSYSLALRRPRTVRRGAHCVANPGSGAAHEPSLSPGVSPVYTRGTFRFGVDSLCRALSPSSRCQGRSTGRRTRCTTPEIGTMARCNSYRSPRQRRAVA